VPLLCLITSITNGPDSGRNSPLRESLFVWPSPSPGSILGSLLVLLMLLALVFVAWRVRCTRARRRRLAAEMCELRELAEEKGLSLSELGVLEDLVLRRSPDAPMKAVTVRRRFNECVVAEMEEIARGASTDRFAAAGAMLRDIRVHLGLDYVPHGQAVGSTRELHSGQTLWMAPATGEPTWIRMNLVFLDEAYLRFRPGDPDHRYAVSTGDGVRFHFWRDEDARYTFESSVTEIGGDPPSLLAGHSDELKRVQSRQYFRIRFYQGITMGVLEPRTGRDPADPSGRPEAALLRGRVTNLSAGGAAIITEQAIRENADLRFSLEIPGCDQLTMTARVVSTSMISGGRHIVRVEFTNVSDRIRSMIARHVVQRQQQDAREGVMWR